MPGRLHLVRCGHTAFDFGNGFTASFADRRIAWIFADVRGEIPATIALLALGALDSDFESRHNIRSEITLASVDQIDLRDNEEAGELR